MDKPVIDIYLAGPYSDDDKVVQECRYELLTETFARITRSGLICFSPITHSHVAAKRYGLPSDAGYWTRHNLAFMTVCRELWILTLPGWEDSIGVKKEIVWAKSMGMPNVHLATPYSDPKVVWMPDKEVVIPGDGFLPSIAIDRASR